MRALFLSLILMIFLLNGAAMAKTFHGYDCSGDCSGHEAGYKWAEENDIDDEGDCDSRSESFTEGCLAYVQENN